MRPSLPVFLHLSSHFYLPDWGLMPLCSSRMIICEYFPYHLRSRSSHLRFRGCSGTLGKHGFIFSNSGHAPIPLLVFKQMVLIYAFRSTFSTDNIRTDNIPCSAIVGERVSIAFLRGYAEHSMPFEQGSLRNPKQRVSSKLSIVLVAGTHNVVGSQMTSLLVVAFG